MASGSGMGKPCGQLSDRRNLRRPRNLTQISGVVGTWRPPLLTERSGFWLAGATMDRTLAHGLLDFIDGSPSPFHAVANASARLDAAGFGGIDESAPFPEGPGGHYLVRNGTLIGWFVPPDSVAGDAVPPRRGPHRLAEPAGRPRPDRSSAGFRQLGVEVYGGVLLNSWLDRDLGLSGRVRGR